MEDFNESMEEGEASTNFVPSEFEYQRSLISHFFKNLLTINLLFFLGRNVYDITIMAVYIHFNNFRRIAAVDSMLIHIFMLIEFLTFFIFYFREIKNNKDKGNLRIIKIWFLSYLSLSLFWVLLINAIQYIIIIHGDYIKGFKLDFEVQPYLYIILSSIVVTNAIYQTAVHLNSKLIKFTALGYLFLPTLIILSWSQNIIFSQKSSFWINKVDIVTTLHNVEYIIWLFLLNIKVRNDYFLHCT